MIKIIIVESISKFAIVVVSQAVFLRRAILCPRNETVRDINEYIMDQIQGEEKTYLSCDTVCKATTFNAETELLYPTEFLNSLPFPGIPNHELKLKVGIPVMLLRYINQSVGLCNGTRMTIFKLVEDSSKHTYNNWNTCGRKSYIANIVISPTKSTLPFVLKRRKYHILVCFAMTINKSMGQSLNTIGLYLHEQVLTRGWLCIAFSRVTKWMDYG